MSCVINFESFTDVHSNYDPSKNKSRNIMTIYEKTNVIGLRLEQLAFGAPPLLNESELENCNSLRDIAELELKNHVLPFMICRNINNTKEYWKLRDMVILN